VYIHTTELNNLLSHPGVTQRGTELDMDWIHPWIGLDWVRILRKLCGLDWIGSDDCNPLFFSLIYFLY